MDSGAAAFVSFPCAMRAVPSVSLSNVALAGSPAGYGYAVRATYGNGFLVEYFHGGSTGSGNLQIRADYLATAEL